MKNVLTCLAFVFLILLSAKSTLIAQQDGRIAKTKTSLAEVAQFTLPPIDNKAMLAEEMERRAPGIAPKFAKTISSHITPSTHGNWEDLPNGNALWRMRISSKGAKSLNLGFTTYQMPQGGSLILYSPNQKKILGPFTPADNEQHAQLWTPVLEGDKLVIEVQVPQKQKSNLQLVLSSINHDFLGFSNLLSGSCNIDVICGAADGLGIVDEYRDIIQSVGVYGFNGSTFCTGFLVNNTAQDCRPFFMTADHCGVNSGNAASMVVYWNFQNSVCRQPGSPPSGGNGDGVLSTSNSGAIFRASWSGSDFSLVELDDPINPLANAFFAGWDISPTHTPDSVISVHHPNTDEKRISFEYDNTFIGDQNGNAGANSNYVVIPDWDLGTTEGGSSGAPLFDKNKRIIGQLFGGLAACGNSSYDAFGWINRSWTGAGTPSTRLSDWLDPSGSNVQTLDGRNCAISIIASPNTQNTCSPAEVIYTLQVGQGFGGNVTLSSAGLPSGFTSNFSQNPVAPGGNSTLSVQVPAGYNGSTTFTINSTDGVESSTTDVTINATNASPIATTLSFPSDTDTGISPAALLQWNPQANMTYELEVASDPTFNNILVRVDALSTPRYQLAGTELEEESTYYWRVRSVNPCGNSEWSPVFSFDTGALFCGGETADNLNITISASGSNSVTSSILISDNEIVSSVKIRDLGITHTWVGDLVISLTSPSGNTVVLMSEPDCDEGDLFLSFDDGATNLHSVLQSTCSPSSPAISGAFQPFASLSSFIGESTAGIWTLTVDDNANGDGGSLDQWTLELCTAINSGFALDTGEATICTMDTLNFSVSIGNSFQGAPISLSANNLPSGAAVLFDPGVGTANSTVNGKLFDFPMAGDYSVEIVATNANDTRTEDILVHVQETPQTNLLSPAELSGGLSITPQFIWNAQPNANSYRIELSSDSNFTSILNSLATVDTSWTSPDLEYGTNYFWRVVGINQCGEAAGTVRSFGTGFRVGLEEELGGAIKVFPNPSQGQIQVQLPTPPSEDLYIELYGMDGKQILSRTWTKGSVEQALDLRELGAGIYLLELRQGNIRWNKKLVQTP